MKSYRRVTHQDRCHIWAWLQDKISIEEISRRLGFDTSSVYRELCRNHCPSKGYDPDVAQKKCLDRYRRCRKSYKLRGKLLKKVKALLKKDWSPEQINIRLAYEKETTVSHECIYQFVRLHRDTLWPHLRRLRKKLRGGGRYRQRNGNPHQFTPGIATRPAVANQRGRIGDWERDIFFAANKTPILMCVERKSRYVKIIRVNNLKADTVNRATEKLITSLGKKAFTLTNDRGTEFKVPLGSIKTYYCDPQTPQQRGTVENTIGLARQYIKRNTDPTLLTSSYINNIERKLNFRPRKTLKGKTPSEAFLNTFVALAN